MSEIRKGDLVMVVRPIPCCGGVKAIGQVAQVIGFYDSYRCNGCGTVTKARCVVYQSFPWKAHDLRRIKKIDPLAEPEAEVYREERVAPVSKPEVAVSKSKRVNA